MMTLLIAAVLVKNSSLYGGNPVEFETLLSPVPESVSGLETIVDVDTPGSTNWYTRIDSFRVPSGWAVYSNGVLVADADEPSIRYAPRSGGFGLLDLSLDLPDGNPSVYSYGQFDASWRKNGQFYATATNYTDFSCVDTYGFPLYWMHSHKLDQYLYGAYFASYNAYYERLYYGSLCEGCSPSTEDAPENFWLDGTNYFSRADRPTPASFGYHRLDEYEIITDYVHHVEAMRTNLYVPIPPDYVPAENMRHPSYVYRPGWLLDGTGSVGNVARLYWASTRHPQIVDQNVATGETLLKTPEEQLLELLLPPFDWRKDAIAWQPFPSDKPTVWWESEFWQCYSITLESMFNGGVNPIVYVYDIVGIEPTAGPTVLLRSYDLRGEWLTYFTNAYQFAAVACPNRDAAETEYLKCFGSFARSRKNLPGAFVGANQLLAVMDRLIYVPSQHFVAHNYPCHYWREGEYHSTRTLTINVTWDEGKGKYVLDEGLEDVEFRAVRGNEDSGYDQGANAPSGWITMKIGPVGIDSCHGRSGSDFGLFRNEMFFDDSDAAAVFANTEADDFFEIHGAGVAGMDIAAYCFPDNSPYEYTQLVSAERESGTIEITPSLYLRLGYDTVEPYYDYADPAHRHLPTRYDTDRVAYNAVAFLDRRDAKVSADGPAVQDPVVMYRSLGDESVVSEFGYAYESHAYDLCSEAWDDAENTIGDYHDPNTFIRIPQESKFGIPAGSAYVTTEAGTVKTWDALFEHYVDETRYFCLLPYVSAEEYEQTDFVTDNHYIQHEVVADVLEKYVETEEGWVISTAVTNQTGESWAELPSETVTNNTNMVLLGMTTNTAEISFLERNKGDTAYSYGVDSATNFVAYIDFFETTLHWGYFDITEVHVKNDGTATTNEYADVRHLGDDVYSRGDIESHRLGGWRPVDLTGEDVLALTTNVVTSSETTEVDAMIRVFRDGRYVRYYHDPYDFSEVILLESQLPLVIGEYQVSVDASGNAYDPREDIENFRGEYEHKYKFAGIESADFDWHSMKRIDIKEKTTP